MIEKLKSYIIIAMIAIMIISTIIDNHKISELNNIILDQQNKIVNLDSLHIIDSTAVYRYGKIVQKITAENKALNDTVAKYKGTIVQQTNIIAELSGIISGFGDGNDTDTTKREIDINSPPFIVKGWFRIYEPYDIRLRITADIKLQLNVVELDNDQVIATATTDQDGVFVNITDVTFTPKLNAAETIDELPWHKKIRASVGANAGPGQIGINAGILYNRWFGYIGLDNYGTVVGINYFFLN